MKVAYDKDFILARININPETNCWDWTKARNKGGYGQVNLRTGFCTKTAGHINKRDGHSHTRHLTNPAEHEAVKGVGIGSRSWAQGKGQRHPNDPRNTWSKSPARKAASAAIAKIPFALARHIASVWKPREVAA